MNPQEHKQYLLRYLRQCLRRRIGKGLKSAAGPGRPESPTEDGGKPESRRRPLAKEPEQEEAENGASARWSGRPAASRALHRFPSPIPHSSESLLDLVPGEILERFEGSCYRTCRAAGDFYGDTTELVRRYNHLFQLSTLPGDFAVLPRTAPERVLFLDIETTGLTAAPVFLIGLASLIQGDLVVTQFLARDYAEEAAILANFRERLAQHDALVTFNGKSFDVRYLCDRLIYHGMPSGISHPHVDLLLPARRRWRGRWENCRLPTLEARVCGRTRTGDLASAAIPQAYQDFIRTGNAHLMERVLYHNAMDLATLFELLVILAELEEGRG